VLGSLHFNLHPQRVKGKMASRPSDDAEVATDKTPPPPSFKGRLELQNFMFRNDSRDGTEEGSPVVRRSPRLSTPISASAAGGSGGGSRRTGSISPFKRKAPTPMEEIEDASPPPGSSSSPSRKLSSASPNKRARQTSSQPQTPSQKKRSGQSTSYAPPSTYAHLSHLPDSIAPNLLVLFVGLNPGIQTARTGHAYAHPTNLFWRLLHSSGITPRRCSPTEDRDMPALYQLGLTNIVSRPSRNGAELSKAEMDAGVAILEAKARRWRPESMCVVGKNIWESLWRVRHGRAIRPAEFRYGWQDESENIGVLPASGEEENEREDGVDYDREWKGTRIFVASSTSGLAATLKPQEKERIWRELGEWLEKRREQRSNTAVSNQP